MGVLTSLKAISPTTTAQKVFAADGVNLPVFLQAMQQHVTELTAILKQVISFHPNDSVISATVAVAGSGGTNGPVTLVGTTGTGARFTAKGTISSGALSGPITIVSGGSYSVDPTSLSSEPITGGNLSGATVSLTMSGDLSVLSSLNSILSSLS